MRLVLREYLGTLREEGELDLLLMDLLLSMRIVPVVRPKKGSRQFGVDGVAVGEDPEDGSRKLFVLTIKQGNITRSVWHGSPNAVKPSLDEIRSVHLEKFVEEEHKDLPVKIVLCCNGQLNQTVQPNWASYVDMHSEAGELEFAFWGADEISSFVEEHMLDEFLFPEEARHDMRRTLVLISDRDYDLSHFCRLVDRTISERDLSSESKRRKMLRLLRLCMQIVFYWARREGNLKPALMAAERTVLRTWGWMREEEYLEGGNNLLDEFTETLHLYRRISNAYFNRIQLHCFVQDGLFGYSNAEEIEYPLRVFKEIGLVSLEGLRELMFAAKCFDEGEKKGWAHWQNVHVIANALAALIATNPTSCAPLYDEHGIEMCLGLLLLTSTGRTEEAATWIGETVGRIKFAYHGLGRQYPVHTDSYDTVVDVETRVADPEFPLSTLLPQLAEWTLVLNRPDLYANIRSTVAQAFPETNLQLWYPDEETHGHLYKQKALDTGTMRTSIELPEDFESFRQFVLEERSKEEDAPALPCVQLELPIVRLIASRHFRTPFSPSAWRGLAEALEAHTDAASQKEGDSCHALRCREKTKNGSRCRRQTKHSSGYCWQHR